MVVPNSNMEKKLTPRPVFTAMLAAFFSGRFFEAARPSDCCRLLV